MPTGDSACTGVEATASWWVPANSLNFVRQTAHSDRWQARIDSISGLSLPQWISYQRRSSSNSLQSASLIAFTGPLPQDSRCWSLDPHDLFAEIDRHVDLTVCHEELVYRIDVFGPSQEDWDAVKSSYLYCH